MTKRNHLGDSVEVESISAKNTFNLHDGFDALVAKMQTPAAKAAGAALFSASA